ncbi:hypothetical protein FP744_10009154 [Trichoderma asperellum]
MSVIHVVLFKYKSSATAEAVQNNGFTHAFVVEFASVEDRDYYVDQDPIHQAFKTNAGPTIEKVCVLDYTVGVFE